MTREEAISILDRRTTIPGDGITWESINKAIDMAIAALAPISKKRAEKAWRAHWDNWGDGVSCSFCGTDRPMKTRKLSSPSKSMLFCPFCGKAMTDEAVEMVMERLETLHENNG